MRNQHVFGFVRDPEMDNTKWELIQFRVSPAMKDKFQRWCLYNHCKMSEILCWVIRGILSNKQTYPGYQDNPMDEIKEAVSDVKKIVLSVEKRQKDF